VIKNINECRKLMPSLYRFDEIVRYHPAARCFLHSLWILNVCEGRYCFYSIFQNIIKCMYIMMSTSKLLFANKLRSQKLHIEQKLQEYTTGKRPKRWRNSPVTEVVDKNRNVRYAFDVAWMKARLFFTDDLGFHRKNTTGINTNHVVYRVQTSLSIPIAPLDKI